MIVNPAAIAQINAYDDSKREVFESDEYRTVIEIRPKRPLVQTDHRTFEIGR